MRDKFHSFYILWVFLLTSAKYSTNEQWVKHWELIVKFWEVPQLIETRSSSEINDERSIQILISEFRKEEHPI